MASSRAFQRLLRFASARLKRFSSSLIGGGFRRRLSKADSSVLPSTAAHSRLRNSNSQPDAEGARTATSSPRRPNSATGADASPFTCAQRRAIAFRSLPCNLVKSLSLGTDVSLLVSTEAYVSGDYNWPAEQNGHQRKPQRTAAPGHHAPWLAGAANTSFAPTSSQEGARGRASCARWVARACGHALRRPLRCCTGHSGRDTTEARREPQGEANGRSQSP